MFRLKNIILYVMQKGVARKDDNTRKANYGINIRRNLKAIIKCRVLKHRNGFFEPIVDILWKLIETNNNKLRVSDINKILNKCRMLNIEYFITR